MEKQKIMRKPDIHQATGLSDSTVRRLEMEGRFPRRVKLSSQAVGWIEGEVQNWIEQKASERVENGG
jgi:prophage regulatory protein